MCIVEVISKDKKKSMEVCKLLELEGYETCMCESEKQIKASFSKFNNIRLFVLVLQNARGDDVEDFVKFKENFLPYISNDKKIIISDKGFSGSVTMEQFKKMVEDKQLFFKEKAPNDLAMEERYIKNLSRKVSAYLLGAGFNTKYSGFNYIRDAICYFLLKQESVNNISGTAYAKLAQIHNKNVNSIERNVRVALRANKEMYIKRLRQDFSAKGFIKYLVMDVKNDYNVKCCLEEANLA